LPRTEGDLSACGRGEAQGGGPRCARRGQDRALEPDHHVDQPDPELLHLQLTDEGCESTTEVRPELFHSRLHFAGQGPWASRLALLWVDGAYAGEFEDWVQTCLGWRVVVVRKLRQQVGGANAGLAVPQPPLGQGL
jgi:hypothetical protein